MSTGQELENEQSRVLSPQDLTRSLYQGVGRLGLQAINLAYQNEINLVFRQLVADMKVKKDRALGPNLLEWAGTELSRLKCAYDILVQAHIRLLQR